MYRTERVFWLRRRISESYTVRYWGLLYFQWLCFASDGWFVWQTGCSKYHGVVFSEFTCILERQSLDYETISESDPEICLNVFNIAMELTVHRLAITGRREESQCDTFYHSNTVDISMHYAWLVLAEVWTVSVFFRFCTEFRVVAGMVHVVPVMHADITQRTAECCFISIHNHDMEQFDIWPRISTGLHHRNVRVTAWIDLSSKWPIMCRAWHKTNELNWSCLIGTMMTALTGAINVSLLDLGVLRGRTVPYVQHIGAHTTGCTHSLTHSNRSNWQCFIFGQWRTQSGTTVAFVVISAPFTSVRICRVFY